MQRRHGPSVLARRAVGVAVVALVLGAAALGLTSKAPALAGGDTLYGQVVDVTQNAVVVSLPSENNVWVALNITPTTLVTSETTSAGVPPIALNDWVLATYAVSRQTQGGDVSIWLVAQTVTYSPSPISTTSQNVHVTGRVTAVARNSFTIRANNGTVWRVLVEPSTRVLLGTTPSALSLLQSGDPVQVWGAAAAHVIVATRVVYHVAAKKGTHKQTPA